MAEYILLRAIHVLSVIVWLGAIPADLLLRKEIRAKKGTESEKSLLSVWLKLSNLGGMIGATGILVTGIIMSINLNYGFFQFASGANHWLYGKQAIMVIVIVLIGAFIIPTAKKIRVATEKNELTEETYKNIAKLENLLSTVNILIVINLFLALTRNLG